MKRNTLIKALVSGAVLVAMLAAAFPVFANFTEPDLTALQASGNASLLAALQQEAVVEAAVTNLQAMGELGSLAAAFPQAQQGFYGFRAAMGSSMVNEPYISSLVAAGQSTATLPN